MPTRAQKIKELLNLGLTETELVAAGLSRSELLEVRKELEFETLKESAVQEAVSRMRGLAYKEASGGDEHEKFIAELMAAMEPKLRAAIEEIIKRYGLENPQAPRVSDSALVQGARGFSTPLGSRQSIQKEVRAVDPIFGFMHGLGLAVKESGKKVKTKEKKARDPVSAMLTGISWR